MGYDVHITRADHWAQNQGREITASEWRNIIDADPDLRLAGYNGPDFAIWDGHPENDESWLDWDDGNITTKNPDDRLLRKMLEIAKRLGANVQGDDGELYDGTTSSTQAPTPTLWANASLLSLMLSIIALTMLVIMIPLDSFIRQHYPVGTPMPLKWALLLASAGIVGVLSWVVGTVFAAAAFLLRQPSLRYAGIALAINCFAVSYLVMTR